MTARERSISTTSTASATSTPDRIRLIVSRPYRAVKRFAGSRSALDSTGSPWIGWGARMFTDVKMNRLLSLLILLVSLTGCEGDRPGRYEGGNQGRVVLFALDGADWDVIEPLIDEGVLPHLSALIERGTSADLLSLDDEWVFLPEEKRWGTSPAIWTSIATSKLPREHGITDFVVHDGGVTFPITSNYLAATPVWQILGEWGTQVVVAGWWATWPARPVNGYMISDHVGISRWDLTTNYIHSGLKLHGNTYPGTLLEEIAPFRRGPEDITTEEVLRICRIGELVPGLEEGRKLYELKIALSADMTYASSSLHLMDTREVGFISPYIEGVDIVQHLFWKYMEPGGSSTGPKESDVEHLGGVIRSYHIFADSLLGEFASRLKDGDRLLVVSDHGFQGSDVRSHLHISGEHRRRGVFVAAGAGIRGGYRHSGLHVLDVTPAILYMTGHPVARDMRGSVPLDIFTVDFRSQRRVEYIDSYEKEERTEEPRPIPSPVDSQLIEKLEALGYISTE